MQFVNNKHIKIGRYFDKYFVCPEHSRDGFDVKPLIC